METNDCAGAGCGTQARSPQLIYVDNLLAAFGQLETYAGADDPGTDNDCIIFH
jgi:hypothetical protein